MAKDLLNKTIGRLTVVESAGTKINGSGRHEKLWKCKCECGNEKIVTTATLMAAIKANRMISCGCYVSERAGNIHRTHGLRHTRLSRVHRNICDRCFNPNNKRYQDYGGRGIKVCDEWYTPGVPGNPGLVNFYNWSYANGYVDPVPGTPQNEWPTIDRIENSKGYSPDNCRWVTYLEQSYNRRNTKRIYDGERWYVHSEFEDSYGWPRATVHAKLSSGWSESAIVYAAKHPELKLRKIRWYEADRRNLPKDTYVDKDDFVHLIPIIHQSEYKGE